jgi:hypothetical protein
VSAVWAHRLRLSVLGAPVSECYVIEASREVLKRFTPVGTQRFVLLNRAQDCNDEGSPLNSENGASS